MSHLRDVVYPHRHDTIGILVASREPCIAIARQDALNQSGRIFQRLHPEDLAGHTWPDSWCMAAVLCKGDDSRELAAWAKAHPNAIHRVHFYIHADADPRGTLRTWHSAGLPIHSTWTIKSWKDLSRHFGARLNMQCHDDFCQRAQCPLR